MPSTHQSGESGERSRCLGLAERIGEDPAWWLDQDLMARPAKRQIDHEGTGAQQVRVVENRAVATAAGMVFSLIDGSDIIRRVRAWEAVERRLANDRYDSAVDPAEPREAIVRRLDQREEWPGLHGERPERLPHGPRRPCGCCEDEGVTAADLRERDAAAAEQLTMGTRPMASTPARRRR
ncbi:hypothetical protein EGH21_11065 [Halomicroarcula sp. F13]|uniref:Uncharacterized protein n=1 Tax=Haloarcula rubra TaxID=2487747 RepID=A0AAW4PRE0_9EURY|nr:hypothetical protein [Halomicroarcula rubra]MBX0323568.1 hypothetical protein [Halomicroarcula rubra]